VNYHHLDNLKQKLDAHRPLPPAVINNLREDLVLRWTYHSNAIEGNTLTLEETKVALEGITVGGKTMREHLEAINYREAILINLGFEYIILSCDQPSVGMALFRQI
jgi:Fic family protein